MEKLNQLTAHELLDLLKKGKITIDSIQKDLAKDLFTENPDKTIYVFHSPPNDTNLDQIQTNIHVGSYAIREFIEKHQPFLTLHGHIHETVDVSGQFTDKIGNTICMAPGNHNVGDKLALLVIDTDKIDKTKRKII